MKRYISWNVNGLRAAEKKGFADSMLALNADCICIQETKLQAGQTDLVLPGYDSYWSYAEKKGYSGTAVFTRRQPLSVRYNLGIPEHDTEDHADHRSDAGDVQKLDQHVFPVGQHDIIDAVRMEFCGSLPVIGTEDPFHHPAIDHVSAEQESNTAEEPPHFYINSCFCISC